MKNLFYSFIALSSLTLSGQEKVFSFDKKVAYEIKAPEEYLLLMTPEGLNLNLYSGKDAVLGNSEGSYSFNGFLTNAFLATNNKFFDVSINSLENVLSIKTANYYNDYDQDYYKPYSEDFFGKISKLTNLKTTETYNGFTCNNYQVEIAIQETVKTQTFCVDHSSKINNAKMMIPNQNINGLIIKFIDENNSGLFIKKITDSNLKVTFDEKNAIEKYNEELAKIKAEYDASYAVDDTVTAAFDDYIDNSFDDPIISYSSYATSENEKVNNVFNTIASLTYYIVTQDNDYDGVKDFDRSKAIKTSEESTKQTVKQFRKNGFINKGEEKELNKLFKEFYKDAKDFKLITNGESSRIYQLEDAIADSSVYIFEDYVSDYKNADITDVSLAVEEPEAEKYLTMAPNHCKNLKNNIPDFSDKNLKNAVYNYVGQVCDLYIYNSGYVGLAVTIDALRKSVLDINTKYETMKKEDKEKLNKFLNSLD